MMGPAASGMIGNAALLLLLGVVFFLSPVRTSTSKILRKTAQGVIIGLIGIGLMLTRWELQPGLIFDTRSVLLTVTGLFFGAVPTTIAAAIIAVYRGLLGGVGAPTGVGVTLSSAAIGLLWRYYFYNRRGWHDYYFVGAVVHIVMLGWMLAMPSATSAATLRQITLPVLLIYPLATMLLAKMLESQRLGRDVREEALRNERRLRKMLEKEKGVITLLDIDRRFRYISDSIHAILGYTPHELLNHRFNELIHPEDLPDLTTRYKHLELNPFDSSTFALRVLHKAGHWIWMEHSLTNHLHEPDLNAWVVNSRDITQTLKSQQELQDRAEELEQVLEGMPEAVVYTDRKFRVVRVNSVFTQMFEYTLDEILLKSVELIYAEKSEFHRQVQLRFNPEARGKIEPFELTYRRKNGNTFPGDTTGTPIFDSEGHLIGYLGLIRDVTERKRVRQILLDERQRLANIIEGTGVGTWEWHIESGETFFDERLANMLGYTLEEIQPTTVDTWKQLSSPDDLEIALEKLEKHFAGETEAYEAEIRMQKKDGTWVWMLDKGKVIEWDKKGKPLRMFGIHMDITERKRHEQDKDLITSMLNYAQNEIYIFSDDTFHFTQVNQRALDNLGYTHAEMMSKAPFDLKPEYPEEKFKAAVAPLLAGEKTGIRFETLHERQNGSRYPVEVHLSYQPAFHRFIAIISDITERLEAERALRESEERFRNIMASMQDIVFTLDREQRHTGVYGPWVELAGLSPEHFLGRTSVEIFGEADAQVHRNANQRALQGEYVVYSWSTAGPERERHFQTSLSPLKDTHGAIIGLVGVGRDVTDLKLAEAAKHTSEEQLRTAGDHLDGILWVVDKELRYTVSKGRGLHAIGLEPDQMVGQTIYAVLGTDDENHSQIIAHKRALVGEVLEYEETFGGQTFSATLAPIREKDGSVVGVVGIAVNITDRKKIEEALQQSEELYRNLFDLHSATKLLIDPKDGSILDANQAAARFYGWPVEELKRMRIQQINTMSPDGIEEAMRGALSSARTQFEFRHRLADGTEREVEVFSSRVEVNGRELLHSIVHDITERKHLEEQLRQSQKMEAVGRLAGGVAHDFNNMLAVIMSTAELAMDQVEEGSDLYDDLRQIERAAQRSADLTGQLLAFSRKQIVKPQVVHLNKLIQDQKSLLSRMIGEEIEIRLGLGSELWDVFIDPSQVIQILTNLAVNARDAIHGVGTITIDTANVQLDEHYSREDMPIGEGDHVMISMTDTGTGMDEETMQRIFEPFFTTKERGEGTGLGLAMVYGIVRQNRGVIHVYSEEGMGATFKIYLPRHTGEQILAENIAASRVITGRETILVVEDEESLLKLAKRFLEAKGYHVLIAKTPLEAIELVHTIDTTIHLLLSDVVMPVMNGRQLQEELRKSRPGIRTLFMSGYTANVIAHRGILEEGVEFIQKPFTMKALTQRVREVLDTEQG